jgi:hypothetical protein
VVWLPAADRAGAAVVAGEWEDVLLHAAQSAATTKPENDTNLLRTAPLAPPARRP